MIIHSLLFFLASVCSMGYELLISKIFFELGFDETLSLTIPIGFYLLGMGLGTLTVKRNQIYEQLFKIEFTLISLSLCVPYIIIALHMFLNAFVKNSESRFFLNFEFISLQFFPLIIGYYSGKELQSFFYIFETNQFRGYGFSLTLSYLGSLIAGIIIPFLIIHRISPLYIFLILTLLNIYILLILFFEIKKRNLFNYLALPTTMLLFCSSLYYANTFEHFSTKALYSEYKAMDFNIKSIQNFIYSTNYSKSIERIRTQYQVIDLIPKNFTLSATSYSSPFTVFLNSKPQFDSESYHGYHQSMVVGSKNLSRLNSLKKVLVLGGGDGILNNEILNRNPELNKLIQVELDPEIVKLSSEHFEIRRINENSYRNTKVNVIYQDALTFLRSTTERFDAIFIDFPLPATLDLSKLYSKEFYQLCIKKLNKNGYFTFDVPSLNQGINPSNTFIQNNHKILYATLSATGCKNFGFYGPLESFGFCQPNSNPTDFDYETLANEFVDESVYINFLKINPPDFADQELEPYVNSIFKLKRFVVP